MNEIILPSETTNKSFAKSIAVLPFINMSSDSDNEYFSDGITEEIINALTKVQGLKVTARTSSFAFKGKNIDIQTIGKKLNVASILEGSIRMGRNQVRITAQLINTEDGFHFWSETYDRSLEDIFVTQDEISLKIADKLREHLGHLIIDREELESFKIPLNVYKSYLKARYLIRRLNKPDSEEGIKILEEALVQTPSFSLAYLEIHLAYLFLGSIGVIPQQEAFAKGNQSLHQAISLNKDLAECQFQLAQISLWQKWDLKDASQLLASAIVKKPSYADAYQMMGFTLTLQKNYKAAARYLQMAIRLNPFDAYVYYHQGMFYYFQKEYAKAIISFEKSISFDPNFLFSFIMKAASLVLQNKPKKALELTEKFPISSEADLSKLLILSLVYSSQQNRRKVKEIVQQLEALIETESKERALTILTYVHAVEGNFDKAIELTEHAIQQRQPMVLLMAQDPLLQTLREQVRFQELIKQVLPEPSDFRFLKEKYKKSLFGSQDVKKYKQQLEILMKEEEPHLDPQLSLRLLAKMLPLHPNYLSQLLNQSFNQNFSEFINSYRLETFKQKANNPSLQHYTILALAYESGFNSKTAFNTFFKKTVGKTPSEYWKTIKK